MKLIAGSAAAVVIGLSLQAHATLITFEEPAAPAPMSNAPGASVPAASQLSSQYLDLGVIFSSDAGYAAVVAHGAAPATPSPIAIIGGTTSTGSLSYTAPIVITFKQPGDATVQAVVDQVKILGDWIPLGSGTVSMEVYDIDGFLLTTVTDADTGPSGQGPELSYAAANIHRLIINGTSGTVGFDNLEFLNLRVPDDGPGPAVPVPGTLPLALAGLTALGFARRRRS